MTSEPKHEEEFHSVTTLLPLPQSGSGCERSEHRDDPHGASAFAHLASLLEYG
jgi:hypothetical protein